MEEIAIEQYRLDGFVIEDTPSAVPQVSLSSSAAGGDQVLPRVDLRKHCSPVEDQKKTGSCVANAVVGALELLQNKAGNPHRDLSRAFLYFNARKLGKPVIKDDGTAVPHAMAALIAHGICEERLWPLSEITVNDPPTQACYENAMHYGGIEFAQVKHDAPVTHILSMGLPVVFGTQLPREAYKVAHQTGVVPMPNPQQAGDPAFKHSAHAMLIVGYDLAEKVYIVRNSWGAQYGKGGYILMPFAVMEKCALPQQFWAIGGIKAAPGLELLGQSVKESVQGMVAAAVNPPKLPDTSRLQQGLQAEIGGRIDKSRKDFRSRLRGK